MPLNSQLKTLLDQLQAPGSPSFETMTVEEARLAVMGMKNLMEPTESVHSVQDITIPTTNGMTTARLYRPQAEENLPVLVFFHGGGWTIGNIDLIDAPCRALANNSGCIVVSAAYRLAPEHKFPAAVDDAFDVTKWIAANASVIGGNPTAIAIAGESTGGNLAAAVALLSRDTGGPSLVHQLLIYPVLDRNFDSPSYIANANGYLLTRGAMQLFWQRYLSSDADVTNPYAVPAQADDLSGLPPTTIVVAEYDPLRSEGEQYAQRLAESGVSTKLIHWDTFSHGAFYMAGVIEEMKNHNANLGKWVGVALRSAL